MTLNDIKMTSNDLKWPLNDINDLKMSLGHFKVI